MLGFKRDNTIFELEDICCEHILGWQCVDAEYFYPTSVCVLVSTSEGPIEAPESILGYYS